MLGGSGCDKAASQVGPSKTTSDNKAPQRGKPTIINIKDDVNFVPSLEESLCPPHFAS
jgi:hypothetical protein